MKLLVMGLAVLLTVVVCAYSYALGFIYWMRINGFKQRYHYPCPFRRFEKTDEGDTR